MEKEEKQKRWRPSLRLYREQQEVIERQCEELRAWRAKYHELMKVKTDGNAKVLRSHIESLEQENIILRRSNGLMEEELKRLRQAFEEERKNSNKLSRAIAMLKTRGFWARLFNKEV
jgi:hypothetical protein